MQVKSLAERLKRAYSCFDKIYCNPLKRAVETADILSNKLELNYEIDSRLVEFSVGKLEGKSDPTSWSMFMDLWKEWFEKENLNTSLPGGNHFCK